MCHNTRVAEVGEKEKRKKRIGKAEKSLYSILLSGVKL
jgi:hypothetical protein